MNRIEQSHLAIVAATHPGMTGKNNEDRYAVSAYQVKPNRPEKSLFAVLADGIGGHRAGEVAAQIAVEVVSRRVAESDARRPMDTLRDAIQQASQDILAQSQGENERHGMGSTCACAWVIHDRLYTANVGDSRIYLLRGGSIQRLSNDHTWIQEALEQGILKPEQARGHPNSHVIRRYLGSPKPVEVDLRMRVHTNESDAQSIANQGFVLKEGDFLLLCSDGLTDLVEDNEIRDILLLNQNQLNTAAQKLTDLANERGGHDNITLVIVFVPPLTFIKPSHTRRNLLIALAVVVVLALLGVGVWIGLSGILGGGGPTPTPTIQPSQAVPVVPAPPTPTAGFSGPAVVPPEQTTIPTAAVGTAGSGQSGSTNQTAAPVTLTPTATLQAGSSGGNPTNPAAAPPPSSTLTPTITPWPTSATTPIPTLPPVPTLPKP